MKCPKCRGTLKNRTKKLGSHWKSAGDIYDGEFINERDELVFTVQYYSYCESCGKKYDREVVTEVSGISAESYYDIPLGVVSKTVCK